MAFVTALEGSDPRAKKFRRARRHSRVVRVLRWLLPVSTIAGLGLFAGVGAITSAFPDISIGPLQLQGTSLVMNSPRLTGFDRQRRPYEIVADRARQDIRTPKIVDLETVRIRMDLAANGWMRVTSQSGTYDGDAQTFRGVGTVRVTSSMGYELDLEEALVHIRERTLVSDKPVQARQRENRIDAERMRVSEGGEVIVFEGNVRALMHQGDEP